MYIKNLDYSTYFSHILAKNVKLRKKLNKVNKNKFSIIGNPTARKSAGTHRGREGLASTGAHRGEEGIVPRNASSSDVSRPASVDRATSMAVDTGSQTEPGTAIPFVSMVSYIVR